MDLKAKDIESVDIIGELNGQEVKMLKTYGGFHMAVGLKKRDQKKPEVLAVSSHPALISYQLTKEFNEGFQPKLCKSEGEQLPTIQEVSDQLIEGLSPKGFEAFILQKNNEIDFIITQFGVDMLSYRLNIGAEKMVLKANTVSPNAKSYPDLTKNLAIIINNKLNELNISIKD